MTWFRLPLFVWAMYTVSLVFILATPVLAITLILITAERYFGLPIFDPANGGDPLLFQHLFWFYSHPAVYIMIIPAMGVISEVIACFARRQVFGYTFMIYALLAIALVGFFVWGHHMFVSGMSWYAALVFSFLSFIVAVPSAIKVFNWTATLYRGQISFESPMLYALGFLWIVHHRRADRAVRRLDPARCAHPRHLLHRRALPLHHGRRLGLGALCGAAFLVAEDLRQDVPGILGAVRRHHDVLRLQLHLLPAVHRWATWACRGAITSIRRSSRRSTSCRPRAQPCWPRPTCSRSVYLTWSLFTNRQAPNNPWDATGLEWQTTSPPPPHNFLKPPVVDKAPYDYGDIEGDDARHAAPQTAGPTS